MEGADRYAIIASFFNALTASAQEIKSGFAIRPQPKFQPWKEWHPLTRGMFPIATGSGEASGLEDSPYQSSRENRQRAEFRKRV